MIRLVRLGRDWYNQGAGNLETVITNPLRILQIISGSATSGAERQTPILSRLLQEAGHHVEVMCPPIQWMVDELESAGIVTHQVDMKRAAGIPGMRQALKIINRDRFDVVHAHLARAAYLGFVAGSIRKVPLVCTVHVETREPIYRFIARGNNRIIAVSNFIRGVLRGRGVKDEFIDVVYNGTDFGQARYDLDQEVHREFAIPEDRRLIGLVGRVAPEKGHMVALEALPKVLDVAPEVHLLFVGRQQGEFPDELRRRAGQMKLADRITFTGNREDVPRLFDAMEFSILPSVMESFGLAVIECMARGKPVVATRVGGLNELVVHEQTGLLVEQTPEAFAQGMCYLLENESDRERMGRNAQLLIEEKFTIGRNVERLEAVYQRAVDSANRR